MSHRTLGAVLAALGALMGCDSSPPPQKPVESLLPTAPSKPAPKGEIAVAALRSQLAGDPLLTDSEIRLTVAGGTIRMSGFVRTPAAKLRAAELARIWTVSPVDNRLIVRRTNNVAESSTPHIRIL
jgi:hypothetical protein